MGSSKRDEWSRGMPPRFGINGAEEQCDVGMALLKVTVGLFPASAPIRVFSCPTEGVLGGSKPGSGP